MVLSLKKHIISDKIILIILISFLDITVHSNFLSLHKYFTFVSNNSLKLDGVLPHRYLPRLCQLIDFIVDVITEV